MIGALMDEQTPQQSYYARVSFLRDHGAPGELERFTAEGPPPPTAADGWRGQVLWWVFHPPTTHQLAELLAHMRDRGLIDPVHAWELSRRPVTQAVSVLRALMVMTPRWDPPARLPGAGPGEERKVRCD